MSIRNSCSKANDRFLTIMMLLATIQFICFFISTNASNIVTLTADTFDKVLSEKPMLVKFYVDWCGYCKKIAPIYEELADKYIGDKNVAIAQVNCDTDGDLSKKHNIGGFPTIKWFEKGQSQGVPYEGDRTSAALDKYIKDRLIASKAGIRQTREVKSDVINTPKEILVTLGDSNFTEYVNPAEKNVLVKFYAPWCGHCKNMAEDYKKLAIVYKNDPFITIAKVDATVHSKYSTKFSVAGYPTLKYFPAGSDKEHPIDYEGGRKLKDMVEFMNKNTGASRDIDGKLTPNAGIIPELESFIKGFFAASDKIKYAEEQLKSMESLPAIKLNSFKHYMKTGELIITRGPQFVTKEIIRLEKILKQPKAATPSKVDEMQIRLNILKEFKKIETEFANAKENDL